MKFKSLSAGALLVGAIAASACFSAPAQALTFVYNDETSDLSNNSVTPTVIGSPPLPATGLPADSDALAIIGNFNVGDVDDYAQFTLGQTANAIDIVMNSSHIARDVGVVRELGYAFYQGGIGGTLLSSGIFGTNGGDLGGPLPDGAFQQLLTGNFSPGTYSFRTFVNNPLAGTLGDIDYGFRIEATQAVPTPALLPGLIGMGMAVIRKRKAEAAMPDEAEV